MWLNVNRNSLAFESLDKFAIRTTGDCGPTCCSRGEKLHDSLCTTPV
jgi:hypothetical protein